MEAEWTLFPVINYKGGVGKTTPRPHCGATCLDGKNSACGLDPQASLNFSLVSPDYWEANLEKDGRLSDGLTQPTSANEVDMNDLLMRTCGSMSTPRQGPSHW